MRPRRRLHFSLAAIAIFLAAKFATAAVERSVSSSRQFIVFGGDVRFRGAICDLAEQSKRTLLSVTAQHDDWKTPIIINAQPPQANLPDAPPASLIFSQTGAGLKLQLDLTIAPDVRAPAVEQELLRALLIEMAYRDQSGIAAGASYVEPPLWLIEGILAQAHNRGAAAEILTPLVEENKTLGLDEFLRQRPQLLDPTSRKLYDAYSTLLLELITDSPGGRQSLARFIRDLPAASIDPLADLIAHVPALNGEGGIARAWSGGLTQIVTGHSNGMLGVSETERTLKDLLKVRLPAADQSTKSYAIDEFRRILRVRGSQRELQRLSEQLLLLEPRANPVYREIVIEYHEIAALLARGRTDHVAERLARVKEWRAQLSTRMGQVDDYLNWFEATQSRTQSGRFANYLEAAVANANEPHRRRDAISLYLDNLETQLPP